MFLYPKLFPRDIHETGLRKLCTSRHLLGIEKHIFRDTDPPSHNLRGPAPPLTAGQGMGCQSG